MLACPYVLRFVKTGMLTTICQMISLNKHAYFIRDFPQLLGSVYLLRAYYFLSERRASHSIIPTILLRSDDLHLNIKGKILLSS